MGTERSSPREGPLPHSPTPKSADGVSAQLRAFQPSSPQLALRPAKRDGEDPLGPGPWLHGEFQSRLQQLSLAQETPSPRYFLGLTPRTELKSTESSHEPYPLSSRAMTPWSGTPRFLYFPEILQTWEDSSPRPADLLTSGRSTTTISECPHVLRMVPARLSGQRSPCQPHVTAWIPALGERSAPLTRSSIYLINEWREDFPSIPLCNISATLQAGYYYLKRFEDNHQLTEPRSSTSFCPTAEPLLSSDAQRAPFNEGDVGTGHWCVTPPYSGQGSGAPCPSLPDTKPQLQEVQAAAPCISLATQELLFLKNGADSSPLGEQHRLPAGERVETHSAA